MTPRRAVPALAFLLGAPLAPAVDFTVAHIFGDNMVIQRDKPIRVWGTAKPGHHERIIPIPSFRTDNWDWPEAPFKSAGGDAANEHRQVLNKMREQARKWSEERPFLEAKALLGIEKGSPEDDSSVRRP